MNSYYPFEIDITLLVQRLGEWLTNPMLIFSFLGNEEFFLFLIPALYWCVNSALGIRVGIIMFLSIGINTVLKIAFHSPRPYWYDPRVKALSSETSFGFPSGHAQNSTTIWGIIAANSKKIWIQICCVLIIFLIGFSRIYLGVHFVRDVIGGWLIGASILFLFVKYEKRFLDWFLNINFSVQILLAIVSSVLLTIMPLIMISLLPDWQIPQSWLDHIATATPGELINPMNAETGFTIGGAWLGITAGLVILLKTKNQFETSGIAWKVLVRFIVGMIGTAILYAGLKAIFPTDENLISYLLRYIRYALVGIWVTFFAPYIFLKLKLADKKSI